jgi:peptidoglycan/xylan/chitin deacetylase (PgdA/CDA1 family)
MTRGLRRACGALAVVFVVVTLSAVWVVTSPRAVAATTCPSVASGVRRDAPGAGKTVALTFDDGPGRSTGAILRILADARVEATFFNVGTSEASARSVVRDEHVRGFALGDHTWDHADLTYLDAAGQASEIDRERAEQASITGAYACLLRPPYGTYNDTTLRLAQRRGMRVWNWSVDTEDWKAAGSGGAYWVDRIVSRAEAGRSQNHPVILMHNQPGGNPATVRALPTIIRFYKSRGYRFVDLYGRTGVPTVNGVGPASGSVAGGTRVKVTGEGFVGVLGVRFGGVAGTAIRVESAMTLFVTSPRHVDAVVDVRVLTRFGTSDAALADIFTYDGS